MGHDKLPAKANLIQYLGLITILIEIHWLSTKEYMLWDGTLQLNIICKIMGKNKAGSNFSIDGQGALDIFILMKRKCVIIADIWNSSYVSLLLYLT